MSGSPPSRVAVQVGGRTVRLAGAAAAGDPWLIAERPDPEPEVARLLTELIGSDLEELVLVHPAGWSAPRVAELVSGLSPRAGRLRAVPVPLAAAAAVPCLVFDVGYHGAEVTRLAADGSVVSCRTVGVGGAHLDAALATRLRRPLAAARADPGVGPAGSVPVVCAVGMAAGVADGAAVRAEAQRVREWLSLLPAVRSDLANPPGAEISATDVVALLAEQLRPAVELLLEVLGDGAPAPVLLIGGVARAPLLAELLDAAGCPDVVVAPRPEAAAVLGALRLPAAPSPVASSGETPGRAAAGGIGTGGIGTGGAIAGGANSPTCFPVPRRRPLRAALLALAATAAAAILLGAGVVLFPPDVAPAAGALVQYGYRIEIPAGWEHTGGLPERRRVLLTPAAAPDGNDLIAVERTPLGYDTAAERPRALAELRAEYEAAVAGGSALTGYRVARAAGREVVRYEQREPDGRTVVDWFVVLEGNAQFSVGCRHNPSGGIALRAACTLVVGSVRRG